MHLVLLFIPSIIPSLVPEYSDLTTLPTLCVGKGDLQIWHTQLLKAAKSSSSLKQRLVSAIICAAAYEECECQLSYVQLHMKSVSVSYHMCSCI